MTKKVAAIVVLVMVTSLSLAGCTFPITSSPSASPTKSSPSQNVVSDKTTFSSDRGYSITYPRAWAKDVNKSAVVELYLNPNPSNTLDGVVVASEKLNATKGTTLQDFVDSNLKDISNYQDYGLLSFERTTLGGQQASKAVWQATVPQKISETNRQNAPLKAMQVFTIYNGTGFVVTYKASQSDYDKYLTQAQQVMNSFEFNSRVS